MKIIVQAPEVGQEERVIIECKTVTPQILKVIEILGQAQHLTVFRDNEAFLVPASEIFYIETIDNKTYVYCDKEVYQSRMRLVELEEVFDKGNFFRASKQLILNLSMIKSVAPANGGRFQALLVNDERVLISRQFVPKLKEVFGL